MVICLFLDELIFTHWTAWGLSLGHQTGILASQFSLNASPIKNYEKCFLFHLKSSFHSQDIQFFIVFSLPFHTFQIQKDKWKFNNL